MADKNHEMWGNLGMDLETHDQLCAVLPTAFGDVYLSQENRPEGMDFFNMVVADIHGIRPAELIEALTAKYKNISRLFVSVSKLSKAMIDMGRAGTPLYLAYNEMKEAR